MMEINNFSKTNFNFIFKHVTPWLSLMSQEMGTQMTSDVTC
jgi:hypothetical protein